MNAGYYPMINPSPLDQNPGSFCQKGKEKNKFTKPKPYPFYDISECYTMLPYRFPHLIFTSALGGRQSLHHNPHFTDSKDKFN